MLKYQLTIAWRNLKKNGFDNIINMIGLSVAMAVAILILLWVKNQTSFDTYHAGYDLIYRISCERKTEGNGINRTETSPYLIAAEAKREIPEIATATRCYPLKWDNKIIRAGDNIYSEKAGVYVDENWFRVFTYEFVEGNVERSGLSPNTAVLTDKLAEKYFGTSAAVGRTLYIDNKGYTVQGVVKDNPYNSSFPFEIFLPVSAHFSRPGTLESDSFWGAAIYETFIKFRSPTDKRKVEQELTAIYRKNTGDGMEAGIYLRALKDIHFESDITFSQSPHGDRNQIYFFIVLGILLLGVASINYINLVISRTASRGKEIAMKKIIGAENKTIFQQFIIESILTCLFSLVLSIAIVIAVLPVFRNHFHVYFEFNPLSADMWLILAGTLVTTVLLTAIYPALLLSSVDPLGALKGMRVLKVSKNTFRKAFIVFQFAITVILIVFTLVIFRQLNFARAGDAAYRQSQIFSFSLPFQLIADKKGDGGGPGGLSGLIATLKADISSNAGVEAVCLSDQPVEDVKSTVSGNLYWDGKSDAITPTVTQLSADGDFKKVFLPVVESGRWFTNDPKDQHNFILNETALRELGIPGPVVGRHMVFQGDSGSIIGVVKDFHYRSYYEKIAPLIITNNPMWQLIMFVRINPLKNPGRILMATEKAWKQYFPEYPFEYTFLDDSFNQLYEADIANSFLVSTFSMITILISCLGLLGLSYFSVQRRMKEIMIRKQLGAGIFPIVMLLCKSFLEPIALGIAIGSPVAWILAGRWLRNFAYRTDVSWWLFPTSWAIAILVAIGSVSIILFKAAYSNPARYLRME